MVQTAIVFLRAGLMTTNLHKADGAIYWLAVGLLVGSLIWLGSLGMDLYDAWSLERQVSSAENLESRVPARFLDEENFRGDPSLVVWSEGKSARAIEALAEAGPPLGALALASAGGLVWIRRRRSQRAAALRASRLPAESQAFLRNLQQFAESDADPPKESAR